MIPFFGRRGDFQDASALQTNDISRPAPEIGLRRFQYGAIDIAPIDWLRYRDFFRAVRRW